MTTGTCLICACTWDKPCYLEGVGPCWWIDDEETLCSHCGIWKPLEYAPELVDYI